MPEIKQDLRTATMIVAASNSLHRNMANYVCDMVADNVEIQAALDAVAAGTSTMGRVVLLDGWYFCAAGVTIPDNVTLEGQGRGTIIDFSGAAIVNGLIINGDYVGIKNLAVNIADGAGVGGARPNAIYSTGQDHTWIENVYAYGDESEADDGSDLRQCGILLVNGSDSKIRDCFIRDFQRHGIHLNDYIDTTVEGCSSLSNGQWGILLLNNSDWNVIVGNKSYLNDYGGINIETSDDCTVSGNVCDTNLTDGILLSGSDRNTVTGNSCVDNDGHGIFLDANSMYNTVNGNSCINNDASNTATYDGINVGGNSRHNKIIGNQCTWNHRYGIGLETADNNSVIGNYVFQNDRHGIYADLYNINISNNTVYDNGLDTINTYDGIHLAAGCFDCTVSNNMCLNPSAGGFQRHGIYLAAGASSTLIDGNNCVYNIQNGICLIDNNSDCNIIGNRCDSNGTNGIALVTTDCARGNIDANFCVLNGFAGIYSAGLQCKISNNYCHRNSQAVAANYNGIVLPAGANRSSVQGNMCTDLGASQEDGILVANGVDDVQINDNYCYNNMGDGIELGGNNADCQIKDNYCHSNDDYGIRIGAGCTNTVVHNNRLQHNGTGAILDGGTDTALPEVVIDAPNPDANIGEFPAQQMLDLVDTEIRMKLHCPNDFRELVRAQVVLVPAAGGDLRRQVDTDFGKVCSEAYNAHSDAIAVGTVAVTADKLECIDIAEALDGIAASDWIGVRFTRNGSDALDTVGATVYLIGMRMQYV